MVVLFNFLNINKIDTSLVVSSFTFALFVPDIIK